MTKNHIQYITDPKILFWLFIIYSLMTLNAQIIGQPNIVLIMADDVGYEIPGYTGGTTYQTPNIDQLAEGGMQFTHCYSTPKCAPSRVTIMTGRYLFRTTEQWGHIPAEERTFGHILQEAGYSVALAGKWQMALLKNDPLQVRKMGFEQFCVFGWHEGPRYHQPYIYQNGIIRDDVADQYGPDVYLDFLIDFMAQNKDRPFLAYYPMAVAHEVSNDFLPPPPPGPDGHYQTYAELISVMDKNIGRLIAALDSLGLRENTVILFTSDNGTPQAHITDIQNNEYIKTPIISKMGEHIISGGKGTLTDFGTRVPMIVNWPGNTPAGKICSDLIDFSDFMPTLAELAGAELPDDRPIDGHSFVAQIRGHRGQPRDWIYNQFEGQAWIRNHRWKFYSDDRLFDMTSDPFEKRPLFPEMDDRESKMARRELRQYLEDLKGVE